MTNEDIVKAIQDGNKELYSELWERLVKFISMFAENYLSNYPEKRDLKEDMINESFIALVNAVERFDIEKGFKFTTFFSWYLIDPFRRVIFGTGQRNVLNEPLNSSVSMDQKISHAEDMTIQDTLIDEKSENYFQYVIDRDFYNSVHEFLNNAIHEAVANDGAKEFILYMLQHNATYKETFAIFNYAEEDRKRIYQEYRKGIFQIRKHCYSLDNRKELIKYGLDLYDIYVSFNDTGLGSFKNHGSSVERAVIRIDKREKANRICSIIK